MQPPHQHSRINLAELRAQMVKKLGPDGSKQYFYYLQRFLSLKLSNVEFNKLCLRILGRENIPLHNQLIRSILRNASSEKAPPPPANHKETLADGYQQNGSHISTPQVSGSPGLPNGGDILPISPRKTRTFFRDRKSGDRCRALKPNGKTSFPTATRSSDFNAVLENGDLNPPVDSKRRTDSVIENDRSPLRAPLGVPFCPASIGGAHKGSSSRFIASFSDGILWDSLQLQERMQHIAVGQGLEGVSVDCANILNRGLDSYLKGLIRSCTELVGAKNHHEHKQHHTHKLINGVNQYQMQNSGEVQEQRIQCPISLQDFRVAMELNPRQLGEDWPLLLEKICTKAFEE